jgi:hypothetical protein
MLPTGKVSATVLDYPGGAPAALLEWANALDKSELLPILDPYLVHDRPESGLRFMIGDYLVHLKPGSLWVTDGSPHRSHNTWHSTPSTPSEAIADLKQCMTIPVDPPFRF